PHLGHSNGRPRARPSPLTLLRPGRTSVTGSDPGTVTAWSAATDPVLAALADARSRRDQADAEIPVLLAYARELTFPRPYRLADLAAAAGMSISGVRVAYTPQHIQIAQHLLRALGSVGHGTAADFAGFQPADA